MPMVTHPRSCQPRSFKYHIAVGAAFFSGNAAAGVGLGHEPRYRRHVCRRAARSERRVRAACPVGAHPACICSRNPNELTRARTHTHHMRARAHARTHMMRAHTLGVGCVLSRTSCADTGSSTRRDRTTKTPSEGRLWRARCAEKTSSWQQRRATAGRPPRFGRRCRSVSSQAPTDRRRLLCYAAVANRNEECLGCTI